MADASDRSHHDDGATPLVNTSAERWLESMAVGFGLWLCVAAIVAAVWQLSEKGFLNR
jgi:hypothetical protein